MVEVGVMVRCGGRDRGDGVWVVVVEVGVMVRWYGRGRGYGNSDDRSDDGHVGRSKSKVDGVFIKVWMVVHVWYLLGYLCGSSSGVV